MTDQNTLKRLYAIDGALKEVNALVYEKCGFALTNLKHNTESSAYSACAFELNGKKIRHRTAKITPTKTGQFVTIWERNKQGITAPYDASDDFDFVVVTAKNAGRLGQFIFPKMVLAEKGIVTYNGKKGKRGIRVYPPWDRATSKQAQKTQNWQAAYFLTVDTDNSPDLEWVKSFLK